MNYKQQTERGIGLMVGIAIFAAIALGGVVAVNVYTNGTYSLNDDEVSETAESFMSSVKADVSSAVDSAESSLITGVNASINASLQTIVELRTDIANTYGEVDAAAQAELDVLDAQLEKAQVELENQLDAAIDASADAAAEVEAGAEAMMDDMGNAVDMNADSNTEAEAEANTDGAGAEASGSVEINTSL